MGNLSRRRAADRRLRRGWRRQTRSPAHLSWHRPDAHRIAAGCVGSIHEAHRSEELVPLQTASRALDKPFAGRRAPSHSEPFSKSQPEVVMSKRGQREVISVGALLFAWAIPRAAAAQSDAPAPIEEIRQNS